jgi:hypothetical protein
MGFINNEVYTASNGVQKAGTYVSFANETIYIIQSSLNSGLLAPPMLSDPSLQGTLPTEAMYFVRANYRIFWDEEARASGKSFIDLKQVSTQIPQSQLSSNIYNILYDVLKQTYTNTSDALRTQSIIPSELPPVPSNSVPSPAPTAPVNPAPVDSPASLPTPVADSTPQ